MSHLLKDSLGDCPIIGLATPGFFLFRLLDGDSSIAAAAAAPLTKGSASSELLSFRLCIVNGSVFAWIFFRRAISRKIGFIVLEFLTTNTPVDIEHTHTKQKVKQSAKIQHMCHNETDCRTFTYCCFVSSSILACSWEYSC